MASPSGYNNPAYNHQFDSSLYEYQYVPEIDPDLDGESNSEREQIHLVHPSFQQDFSEAAEEFDASDESNQSIIVEECNNRRITLICEKRSRTYEDSDCRGAYHHDISLESEKDYEMSKRAPNRGGSSKQGRPEPGASSREEHNDGFFVDRKYEARNDRNNTFHQANGGVNHWVNRIPQRRHRYEEIVQCQDGDAGNSQNQQTSRHRYAEITVDENGYPSIGNEIEIERSERGYKIVNSEIQREFSAKSVQKPRAASPINLSFSPNFSPSKTYHKTVSPHPPSVDINLMRLLPTNPASVPNRSVPIHSIEMSELSPPHQAPPHAKSSQRFSYESPKRQFHAEASADLQNQVKIPTKNVKSENSNHRRYKSVSESNFEEQPHGRNLTPKARIPVAQIFHAKTTPRAKAPKGRANPETEKKCVRRNISNSFLSHSEFDPITKWSNPYKPTTAEVEKTRTAIITPILQRKSRRNEGKGGEDAAKFQKLSHTFQSTGNLYKDAPDADCLDHQTHGSPGEGSHAARIKRNQSVPNFAQTFANEGRFKQHAGSDHHIRGPPQKPGYQCSPTKSVDRFSAITRSRISLIDQTKMSWSNSGTDFHPSASGCLIVGAVVQIVTSIVSCAICFYLFSKLGRRYYLDFGILAGFVNLVLGVLGFRSQCWRWLPNRNYVSGYILLTAFSILTCSGFVYLITARPMSGDPILDLMGGGICGISVLTILLSVTGLTMSGCCKTPPPDNRVNNI